MEEAWGSEDVMARLNHTARELHEGPSATSADALFELGMMYCSGRDVRVDLVAAHKWFNLAAMRGNAAAKRYRVELAAEMTKVEIARAQKQAREWMTRH
jgi:TPR repeat protein